MVLVFFPCFAFGVHWLRSKRLVDVNFCWQELHGKHHHVECDYSLSHVDDLEGLVSKMWRDQSLNLSCFLHLLFYCCTMLLLSLWCVGGEWFL